MRQIVLDTETTGLDPKQGHRIIEVGCLEMVNRQLTRSRFHAYYNPERAVDRGALQVHGLDDTFLSDKPRFAEQAKTLLAYLQGAELIIHNAPFDVSFLNHEFARVITGFSKLADYCEVTDTLLMARKLHPGQKNSLDALCKRYSVDNTQRDLHGALIDAKLLALVYLRMTGGQDSLFVDQDQANVANRPQYQQTATVDATDLPVITATVDEVTAHQQWLQLIKDKSGQPSIWESIDMIDC